MAKGQHLRRRHRHHLGILGSLERQLELSTVPSSSELLELLEFLELFEFLEFLQQTLLLPSGFNEGSLQGAHQCQS